MVGAISPHPSRPAIEDPPVAAFAAAAHAGGGGPGLVLVSFGSNSQLFGSLLGRADYEQLALGFADLAPVGCVGVGRGRKCSWRAPRG